MARMPLRQHLQQWPFGLAARYYYIILPLLGTTVTTTMRMFATAGTACWYYYYYYNGSAPLAFWLQEWLFGLPSSIGRSGPSGLLTASAIYSARLHTWPLRLHLRSGPYHDCQY